ncbi:MAG: hypothetical protein SPD56_02445 [Alloprevotella sp.]|nr:hypothetical protein [Alloprevotella sp.]
MKKIFDFKRVGRRMPYEVPTDFFDEFSRSVADRLSREQSAAVLAPSVVASAATGRRRMTIVRRLALGMVAAVALFFLVRLTWTAPQPAEGDFEYVATAYSHLSEADQALFVQLYEDDVFMDENL